MAKAVFLVAIVLVVGLVVSYIHRRKRADWSLSRAVAVFGATFLAISAAGFTIVAIVWHMFEIDSRYIFLVALFLLFGFFAPGWHLATERIAPTIKTRTGEIVVDPGRTGKAQVWLAIFAGVTLISVAGVVLSQGYDLTPILWLFGAYLVVGVVIGGGTMLLTKIRQGRDR